MANTSWVQPYEDSGRRVVIPHVTQADESWSLDTGWVWFEGRTYPVAARGPRETQEWTITTVWGEQERATAEDYLALLRSVAQESDRRLDLHIEVDNGAVQDLVVRAVEVPQQIGRARTNIAVTFQVVDATE